MTARTHVAQRTTIYDLRADEISLDNGEARHGQEGYRFLNLVHGYVWATLGRPTADLAAEGAALRKLAKLATEVADELEQRAAEQPPASGS